MVRWWRGVGGALRTAAAAPPWRRASSAEYHRTIQAVPRERTGGRAAAKERADGRIPAVVLGVSGDGGGAASAAAAAAVMNVTTEAKQIRELLKENSAFFCSTPIRLQVRAGARSAVVLQSGTVLPMKVRRDRESGKIMNLVMAWAEKGMNLKVNVPVVFKGEDVCPGLKKGGYLHKLRTRVKYLCPAENIPQKFEVDLTNRDIGDKIYMHEINVDPSLKLLSKDETTPICEILATKPVEAQPEQIKEAAEAVGVTEA
ncbi:uncharacterized protein LOC109712327 [Ananas comosus]|uniref:Uncharacterized protein LOC109712327 n=1 Tax=Ananas comosus TaxID=4615 RepID=A0A6P5F5I4_ANACO|nr:uncharacterized protein LOC109712327 [Ananas comosus]